MATEKNVKSAKSLDQPKPKAYSYVRFSTPDQMKGNSFERQTEKAAEYANTHGLELDTTLTFQDLGVSAFRGKNAQTGALRAFFNAVEQGDIPQGSYLLVESLDRLSRMDPWDVLPIFQMIINAGITIVTLQDSKEWNRETVRGNPMRIIESLLVMTRAHEESAIKSMRVASAYERKRERAANGDKSKPFTRMLPAWLYWDEGRKEYGVHAERAAIIRDIFAKAVDGWGQHRIAHWLNDRHIPTWGDASQWHRSYVKKILTNPAVIGTFTPHKKLPDGDGKRRRTPVVAIENHFPAVVDRELFDTVALRAATTASRGRHANRAVRSLFAGVLRCSQCGATVSRVSKGKHVYLVCAKANSRAGTHPYHATRYGDVEGAFRRLARAVIKEAPRTKDTDLQAQMRNCGVSITIGEAQTKHLVDELLDHKSPAIRQRLQQAEAQLEKLRDELRALVARRDALEPERVERRLKTLLGALTQKPFNVAAANAAMRQAIKKIVMDAEQGTLKVDWQHTDDTDPQTIYFPNSTRLPAETRSSPKAP